LTKTICTRRWNVEANQERIERRWRRNRPGCSLLYDVTAPTSKGRTTNWRVRLQPRRKRYKKQVVAGLLTRPTASRFRSSCIRATPAIRNLPPVVERLQLASARRVVLVGRSRMIKSWASGAGSRRFSLCHGVDRPADPPAVGGQGDRPGVVRRRTGRHERRSPVDLAMQSRHAGAERQRRLDQVRRIEQRLTAGMRAGAEPRAKVETLRKQARLGGPLRFLCVDQTADWGRTVSLIKIQRWKRIWRYWMAASVGNRSAGAVAAPSRCMRAT